jgi:tetratricopeptide (TPR) repeat protein
MRMRVANLLARQGETVQAIVHYRAALAIDPRNAKAHDDLAVALSQQGKLDEALPHFAKALESDPKLDNAHYNWGMILYQQGKVAEAIDHWRSAVRLKPNQIAYLRNLALALAISADPNVRSGTEAVELARHAAELTENRDPDVLATLAAAYAEAGQFPKAIAAAEQALELASALSKADLVDELTDRLKLYRAGSPYHDVPRSSAPVSRASNKE